MKRIKRKANDWPMTTVTLVVIVTVCAALGLAVIWPPLVWVWMAAWIGWFIVSAIRSDRKARS